ncbi:MAG: NnrU family protein [Dongiaceae bacterium]
MLQIVLAMTAFVGMHFLLSSRPLRDPLVARLGEGPFRGLYSSIAAASLIWVIVAYNHAPAGGLWTPPAWLAPLPAMIMPLAVLLLVGALTQPNPTLAGMEKRAALRATGVLAITRHPMLWAIAIWALLHMIANPDVASRILFGGLVILSLGGTLAIDARKRRQRPAEWAPFVAASSNLPFAALLSGRARLRFADLGWWRLALAAVLYAALLALHPILFGAPAVPVG